MKKVLSLIVLVVLVSISFNVSAKTVQFNDPFDDCLEEAEVDYSITGDLESAIDVYNECVDRTINELKRI